MSSIMYFGAITASYPPTDDSNLNGIQYEYDAILVGDSQCLIPAKHLIRMDLFGSDDEFDDTPLRPGSRVVVLFRDSSLTSGLIIGCLRRTQTMMPEDEGVYRRTRFNETEQVVNRQGAWSITLDQGDKISVSKEKITLDNDNGESITIDRESQTIAVKAGKDWKLDVGGDATINATGNVTINCAEAKIKTTGNTTIEATGSAKIKATEATIEATVSATVKAAQVDVKADASATVKAPVITLGNGGGSVITTATMPTWDLITGAPSMGVPTISAG